MNLLSEMNPVFNLFNGQILGEVSTSNAMDFVRTLQLTKKSQATWSELNLVDRSAALIQISREIEIHKLEIAQDLARTHGLSIAFQIKNEVEPAARAFERAAAAEVPPGSIPKPTGLISFLAPEQSTFRFLAERVSASLMAGNSALIATSIQSSFAGHWMRKVCAALPENLLQVFHSDFNDENLLQILCAHPSISGVCSMGLKADSEKVLRLSAGSWKKLQVTSGYHNSALILNDCNLSEASEALLQSCFTGMGQLHGNISNILVIESQVEAFQREFLGLLEQRSFATSELDAQSFGPLPPSEKIRIEQLWQTVRSENGKILSGGTIQNISVLTPSAQNPALHVRPLVVQDMSHCSVLQQDCLSAPVVLISPVKYVHDMFKWANTSYFGMIAQVFGPEEKIQKFAAKLEVSRICGNRWLSPEEALPFGIKQSFSGIADAHPFGSFFSDLRKIDGIGSRF